MVRLQEARSQYLCPINTGAPKGFTLRAQPQKLVDSFAAPFYSYVVALLEESVRKLFVSSLAFMLSASLVVIPTMAAPANPASAPLGFVLQAERANVGADITSGGSPIYDGHRLEPRGDSPMH